MNSFISLHSFLYISFFILSRKYIMKLVKDWSPFLNNYPSLIIASIKLHKRDENVPLWYTHLYHPRFKVIKFSRPSSNAICVYSHITSSRRFGEKLYAIPHIFTLFFALARLRDRIFFFFITEENIALKRIGERGKTITWLSKLPH